MQIVECCYEVHLQVPLASLQLVVQTRGKYHPVSRFPNLDQPGPERRGCTQTPERTNGSLWEPRQRSLLSGRQQDMEPEWFTTAAPIPPLIRSPTNHRRLTPAHFLSLWHTVFLSSPRSPGIIAPTPLDTALVAGFPPILSVFFLNNNAALPFGPGLFEPTQCRR